MNKTLQRFYLHGKRFRLELGLSILLNTLFMSLIIGFYPGEKGLDPFVKLLQSTFLKEVINQAELKASALLFWTGLSYDIYFYLLTAIFAIFIGSKVIPTGDQAGSEYILGANSISMRRYYLESSLVGLVNFLIGALFGAGIVLTFLVSNNVSADLYGRFLILNLIFLIIASFYFSLALVSSVFSFSKSTGVLVGFIYLIFSFTWQSVAPASQQFSGLKDLSLKVYLTFPELLIRGNFDVSKLLISTSLVLAIFTLGLYKIHSIEIKEGSSPITKFRKFLSAKFRFLNLPSINFGYPNFIKKRFPLAQDQFNADWKFLSIWTSIVLLTNLSKLVSYPGEAGLKDAMGIFLNNPALGALLKGNVITYNYTGYVELQIFALVSIFYGIPVAIISANIPSRDALGGYADSIWANNVSVYKVMSTRVTVMVIEVSLMLLASLGIAEFLPTLTGYQLDLNIPELLIITIILFVGLGLLISGISMIPHIRSGKTWGIAFYVLSLLIDLIANSKSEWKNFQYFSVLGYYDPIGVANGAVSFGSALLSVSVIALIGLIIFIVSLIRFSKRDLV